MRSATALQQTSSRTAQTHRWQGYDVDQCRACSRMVLCCDDSTAARLRPEPSPSGTTSALSDARGAALRRLCRAPLGRAGGNVLSSHPIGRGALSDGRIGTCRNLSRKIKQG
jgi:hypothetical protein